MLRRILLALLLCVTTATPARADSWWRYWLADWQTRRDSKSEIISPQTEQLTLNALYDAYRAQHPNLRPRLGDLALNGLTPVSGLLDGTVGTLTFGWLEPDATSPVIGAVQYWANYDPDLMDPENNLNPFAGLTFLGTSTDAGSNFAFATMVQGFEPLYLAVPFDVTGAPIATLGVDFGGAAPRNVALGFVTNIAVVPEPGSAALVLTGVALLLARRRIARRSRR